MKDPKGHEDGTPGYVFQYAGGLLTRDQDPSSGAQTLQRAVTPNGWRVTRTTPLQRSTKHEVDHSATSPPGRTSSA